MNKTEQEVAEERPRSKGRKETSTQVSAWILTAWMALAPLLMLGTIWLLAAFRK